MEHNMLTLDFWQDTVTYEGATMPTGSIGCAALNIPDDMIAGLDRLCEPLNRFMATLNTGMPDPALLPAAKDSALQILDLLNPIPPFSHLDKVFYTKGISDAFTQEGAQDFQAYTIAMLSGGLTAEHMKQYRRGILLGRMTPVLAQLAFSLRGYKQEMTTFAETLDGPDVKRTPEGLAEQFGKAYPLETDITKGTSWMTLTNISVQYISTVRPSYDIPMLVKRMHFVSFVGMLRADLFEGLRVGHAPKKCPICGRWFLTTNARPTKYCGGLAPGDRLGRTCRQIGNMKGREQRELAADHPVKQIYEKRTNTINRYVKRGILDADIARMMKRLAKNKMLRALSDNSYAQGAYAKEMEQDALLADARKQK